MAEAGRAHDLSPSEIGCWVDDAKRGMEDALRANPLEVREHCARPLKDLQEARGEAMLALRARKRWRPARSGASPCAPSVQGQWRAGNDPDAP